MEVNVEKIISMKEKIKHVIACVKQNAIIYEGTGTLEERQVVWQKIAKELNESVECVCTIWYFIRQRYQNELRSGGNISLANELEFLVPYIPPLDPRTLNNESENAKKDEPEFVFTAEDLGYPKDTTNKFEIVEMENEDLKESATSFVSLKGSSCDSPRCSDIEVIDIGEDIDSVNQLSPRCEDDIFGEWVAAMLKTVEDIEKKREIKKAVMNLLLA